MWSANRRSKWGKNPRNLEVSRYWVSSRTPWRISWTIMPLVATYSLWSRHVFRISLSREDSPRKKSIHTDVSTKIRKASLPHFLQVSLPIDLALQCEDALRLLAADNFPQRKVDEVFLGSLLKQLHALSYQLLV